jgi:hypothetical protein
VTGTATRPPRQTAPHEVHDRPDPNEWLSSAWIANDLDVPLGTYYQWRSAGKGPRAIKVGKYVRVRRKDYEAWLDSLTEVAR